MNHPGDDFAKRRLVDREEMQIAVRLLLEHGYSGEDIAPQLTRFYYVDIDTLNEVLVASLAEATRDRHEQPAMRRVA
jgi:hypothetical protein